ncbi:hypothetical protein Mapa_000167 [Marchantia paleacea]|nr:hypothetical protein Mapa_000167 [Marchantia paleacea]
MRGRWRRCLSFIRPSSFLPGDKVSFTKTGVLTHRRFAPGVLHLLVRSGDVLRHVEVAPCRAGFPRHIICYEALLRGTEGRRTGISLRQGDPRLEDRSIDRSIDVARTTCSDIVGVSKAVGSVSVETLCTHHFLLLLPLPAI